MCRPAFRPAAAQVDRLRPDKETAGCGRIRNRRAGVPTAGFLATSFSRMGESCSHAAPVGDPVVLQVDRGRVGARIVGADDLNGAAVAGAVLSR